jgi:tetratricopeptide (TPR) repeat protein
MVKQNRSNTRCLLELKLRAALVLCCAGYLFLFSTAISEARDTDAPASESFPDEDAKVTVSIEACSNPLESATFYAHKSEYCLQHGYVEQAIKLCQMALSLKDDPDLHQIYATALERKLNGQDERDETLYLKCVSEWLIVLRQSGGEENLAVHGISLPGLEKLWGDDDRAAPAKQHILKLTGRLPKIWETNQKFLNRIAKESKRSVHSDVVRSSPQSFELIKKSGNNISP